MPNKKDMLTIKEFADSLNLPKNKINYQVSKLNDDYIVKINGIKYLTKEVQTLIKQSLDLNEPSNLNDKLDTDLNSFKHLFEHFESQLNSKDQQIDRLQTLLDQQQQLTLQGNKQIDKLQLLLDSDSESSEQLKKQMTDSELMLDVQSRMITQLEEIIEEKTERNKLILHELAELRKKNRTSFWRRLFPSKYNNSIRFSDYKIDK